MEKKPIGYRINFNTYGTWLRGDRRGWFERRGSGPSTRLPPNPALEAADRRRLKEPPLYLDSDQRENVALAIRELCEYRGWDLSALHVGREQVFVVVLAEQEPARVMGSMKARATRKLRQMRLDLGRTRFWGRGAGIRRLWGESAIREEAETVNARQGLSEKNISQTRAPVADGSSPVSGS